MCYSKNPEYRALIAEKKSSDDDDEENFKYFKSSFVVKKFFKILIECENNFENKRRILITHPNFSLFEVYDAIKADGAIDFTIEDV